MKLVEAALFVSLAGAAHVMALSWVSLPQGGAGGAQGQAEITLAASRPEYAELAKRWQETPVAMPDIYRPSDLSPAPAPSLPDLTPQSADTAPLHLAQPATPKAPVAEAAPRDPGMPPPAHLHTAAPAAPPAMANTTVASVATRPMPPAPAPVALPLPLPLPKSQEADRAAADPGLPPPRDIHSAAPSTLAAQEPTTFEATTDARPLVPVVRSQAPALSAQSVTRDPVVDGRSPALRGVATAAPAAPEPTRPSAIAPSVTGTPTPRPPQAPLLPKAPLSPSTTADLPVYDMASASSAQAPSRSLRPAPRPEGLASPQAARAAKPAKATKPAAATPARRAASSGGGTQSAKPAAKPAAGTTKPKVSKQAVAAWQQGIARALVRANRRPKTTATGRVALIISVTPTGRLASVRIARSSGNRTLDNAAVANVKRARLPRAPKGFGQAATVRFTYDFTR